MSMSVRLSISGISIYRVRQNKVIPCSVWLISQERSWIFIRKFTRPLVIHIYVQLPNYIILSQKLIKLCYLNRDKPTLYNAQILRLRYWLYWNAPLPCYVGSKFVIPNACSSQMRKTSTSTHLSATRTTACGQEERRSMSGQVACWSRGKVCKTHYGVCWCLHGGKGRPPLHRRESES